MQMSNRVTNPDGTITEINRQTINGHTTITETKYDRNGNIISRSTRPEPENNFNNANIVIYSGNNNNNIDFNVTTDNNGNTIETRTEHLPNGGIKRVTITKDRNGNTINYSSQMMGANNTGNFMVNNMNTGMDWDNFNRNMNNMNNNMNMNMGMNWDNFNRNMNNMNNNMNNMNMNMGMNWNNFNRNMNNMMNNMNNMNNNLNNMLNNMAYMGQPVAFFGNMGNIDPGNPIDPEILRNLPENKIHDPSKLDPEKKNCVICLEDFREGDDIIILPCIHVFHKTCITDWFHTHNDCPICKYKLTRNNVGV